MKKGYKQTDVGVIPEDWDTYRIQNLIDDNYILSHLDGNHGELYPRSHEFKESGIPYIGANDFSEGKVSFVGCKFLSEYRAKQFKKGVAKNGDVLFAHNATVGPVALLKTDLDFVILSTTATYFRCDNKKLLNIFLIYALQSPFFVKQYQSVMAQSTRFQVPITAQRKFNLVLPPKAEQETIAEVLSDADSLIESLEKLIAKKRNIKQGTMQQLLTVKIRLPGFTGKWETKKLGDFCDLQTGRRPKGGVTEVGEVPSLGGENIFNNNGLDLSTIKKVSKQFYSKMSKGILRELDVLINKDGANTGKVAIYRNAGLENACINEHLFILRGHSLLENSFLYYVLCLDTTRNEISKHIASSAQPGLNRRFANAISIPIPATPEQTAIAQLLSDMDAEIETLEKKRAKYKDIKQGMMQELLTGQIRLIKEKVVDTPMTASTRAPDTIDTSPKSDHNWQINEAVVIAALTSVFGSEQYPLGRKRYTKFSYLLHRHVEGKAEGYRKKAAGPYNPDTRYKGPEKIAQNNRYIKPHTNGKFSGFITDGGIEQARGYFDKWYGLEALQWLEQFRYESNEQLELLTTADMAVCELAENKQSVSVADVKTVIRSHPQWKAKLNRPVFSDKNIATAIEKSQDLFGA